MHEQSMNSRLVFRSPVNATSGQHSVTTSLDGPSLALDNCVTTQMQMDQATEEYSSDKVYSVFTST